MLVFFFWIDVNFKCEDFFFFIRVLFWWNYWYLMLDFDVLILRLIVELGLVSVLEGCDVILSLVLDFVLVVFVLVFMVLLELELLFIDLFVRFLFCRDLILILDIKFVYFLVLNFRLSLLLLILIYEIEWFIVVWVLFDCLNILILESFLCFFV